jgi:hypothetical protein
VESGTVTRGNVVFLLVAGASGFPGYPHRPTVCTSSCDAAFFLSHDTSVKVMHRKSG